MGRIVHHVAGLPSPVRGPPPGGSLRAVSTGPDVPRAGVPREELQLVTAVATAAMRVSLDVWVADADGPDLDVLLAGAFGRLASGFGRVAS